MESFVAWRFAAYDTPVRNLPSRREGRYNTAASPPTQYLALHPWGPWAELLRWEDRRQEQDVVDVSTRLWVVRLRVDAPVQRVGFADTATLGLRPEELVSEDYTACQGVAKSARARGVGALVVPSAALPGTENLIVLGPRVVSAWTSEPVDEGDVPASVSADRAGPPRALLPHVRWRGAAHAGLAAWQAGDEPIFPDPVPTPL